MTWRRTARTARDLLDWRTCTALSVLVCALSVAFLVVTSVRRTDEALGGMRAHADLAEQVRAAHAARIADLEQEVDRLRARNDQLAERLRQAGLPTETR